MKHITLELEGKIRAQLQRSVESWRHDHERRMANLDGDGMPPPVEVNERVAHSWKDALEWVLREAGCLM